MRGFLGGGRRTKKRSIVEEYVEKYYKTKKIPHKAALARCLCADFPHMFPSEDDARTMIRIVTGAHGEASRKYKSKRPDLRDPEPQRAPIPQGDTYNQGIIYECDPSHDKILIIGDLHMNFHDERAIELALNKGIQRGINTLLINGDGFDFLDISPFPVDPRHIDPDYVKGRNIETLTTILSWVPDAYVIYNRGNHEDWWQKHLWRRSDALSRYEDLQFENFFHLKECGVNEYLARKGEMRFGRITGIHGDEINSRSQVNPARALYLKYVDNVFANHYHRVSHHSEPTGRGKPIVCWSVGCLTHLRPEYAAVGNKMENGFAILEWSPDEFEFSNYKIYNGKIYGE